MDLRAIHALALSVRKQFEKGAIRPAHLATLYASYNSEVSDTSLFVSHAQHLFPSLNCGLASVYLQHLLGTGMIVQGLYAEQPHTFLLLAGSIVVDITADQYGGPSVYAGPLTNPWQIQ